MRWLAFKGILFALSRLTASHKHDETIDSKEPFVGWTKDDLDAKWGTDVSSMLFVLLSHERRLTEASGVSRAFQPLLIFHILDACSFPRLSLISPFSERRLILLFPIVPGPDSVLVRSELHQPDRPVLEASTLEQA